jgi:hypothetical protein
MFARLDNAREAYAVLRSFASCVCVCVCVCAFHAVWVCAFHDVCVCVCVCVRSMNRFLPRARCLS